MRQRIVLGCDITGGFWSSLWFSCYEAHDAGIRFGELCKFVSGVLRANVYTQKAIVASVYPILMWIVLACVTKFGSKLQSYRISRATDSLAGAPCLIALAVLMGDVGLPSSCAAIFEFDIQAYRPKEVPAAAYNPGCNATSHRNECGNGLGQLKALKQDCQGLQAGFGLVIVTM